MQESEVGVADLQLSVHQTFKRSWMLAYVVTFLFLLWPLLLNGAPFYFDDSASYLRGGRFGLSTGLLMVHHWWQSLGPDSLSKGTGSDPKAIIATAIGQAGGTRSLIYSVVTYLLREPGVSLVALALVQIGAVAFVVCALRQLIGPPLKIGSSILIAGALTFLTSAPWYANFAGPDVLAGVAIAGGTALTVFLDRTRLPLRLLLVLLVAFCITAHGSHLPVALSVLIAGAVAHLMTSRQASSARLRSLAWISSPVILAVAALLGSSYFAFGEWSLAPKRYPIELARSVADGPGAWYLRNHCVTEHYAICEIFGPNPPRTVNDFLWAKNGVRYRATPQQMERIRAEEMTIVRRAALEYPAEQARRSVTNMTSQLLHLGISGLYFGFTISNADDPVIRQSAPDRTRLKAVSDLLIYCSFIASIVLLIVYRRSLARAEVAALLVVAVGLLANAAVCGILSGVTDRYQGRVAWVLPILAFIILLRIWRQSRPPATNAKVALA